MDSIMPSWCFALHENIYEWLMKLRDPNYPGRFKFSLEGNLRVPSATHGLDASCLALKICHMIDGLRRIPAEALEQWVAYIQGFQKTRRHHGWLSSKRSSGFFEDRFFLRDADRRCGLFRQDIKTRRAVTRQACAALWCAGSGPVAPVLSIPANPREVAAYLDSLDWARDPWGAGSHASHLVFFLKLNSEFFGMSGPFKALIPEIFSWLEGIRSNETGSWYLGDPPLNQKINSAMKVLSAYAVLDRPVEQPELLIDFCLGAANSEDGCHNADILFVLHYCSRISDYRRLDIQKFCLERLHIIERFRKPDGAFSFYPEHSQRAIYGVPITRGLCESDLHGTILFLWSLKMIADILECAAAFPWKMPVN